MYTVKILMRSTGSTANDEQLIHLRVTIHRKIKYVNSGLKWPAAYFDHDLGECKPRKKNDKDATDFNIILRDMVGKVNDIFKVYRLQDKPLTIEAFQEEFKMYGSRNDFIQFFEREMMNRYRSHQITDVTLKSYRCTLAKLTSMYPNGLPFFMMDAKWPQKFDNFLYRKENLKINGRFGHHKNVKCILNMAKLNGLVGDDIYSMFKVKVEASKWAALSQFELDKFIAYYNGGIEDESERRVVRQFLFGCFTGLRISDQRRFNTDWIHKDIIIFKPKKTIDYQVRIPMTSMVKQIIDHEINEVGHHKIFRTITEQYANRLLKLIAKKLGIKTNVHHHVARETFATRFISAGGDVMVLKELMGHSSISTTSRYVKQNDQLARVASSFIESFSSARVGDELTRADSM